MSSLNILVAKKNQQEKKKCCWHRKRMSSEKHFLLCPLLNLGCSSKFRYISQVISVWKEWGCFSLFETYQMLFLYVNLHGVPKLPVRLRLMVPNVFPYFSSPLIESFSALRSRLMLRRGSRQLHKSPPWNLQYTREMLIHHSMASRVSQNSHQMSYRGSKWRKGSRSCVKDS